MLPKFSFALLGWLPLAWAEPPNNAPKTWSENEVAQLKQKWHNTQQQQQIQRAQQRTAFLQLETLLKAENLSPETWRLVQSLRNLLSNYPLVQEADSAILSAKLKSGQASEAELAQFEANYPQASEISVFRQRFIDQLYAQQQFSTLINYAQKVKPTAITAQCQLLGSQYQLLAEQAQLNPTLRQTQPNSTLPSALMDLLDQFEVLWFSASEPLPDSCANLASFWRDEGRQTPDKIRQKAVNLAEKNAKKALEQLASTVIQPELVTWLTQVQDLMTDPKNWQNFAENQPLTPENQILLRQFFVAFLKTQAEQTPQISFLPYQVLAEKWQLNETEVKGWKSAFISRFFDNENVDFQQWRDQQLSQLGNDGLIERRLRLAILQKQDLATWLNLLSPSAKSKVEWRYWAAKAVQDPIQRTQLFADLAKERGFYPMLAAQLLNQSYPLTMPDIPTLSEAQLDTFLPSLKRIDELRILQRWAAAKKAWIVLLKDLSLAVQLGLINYATQQQWYDLSVEGTIQAKAWDYLPLRLPNAYMDWFQLHLSDKPIRQTFAMAIARQESAWNPQARSSANAIGLMQLLPSTAKLTAQNNRLPYRNEQDLFNPFSNIMLGSAHLSELHQKYPHNRILIAAAYNAGASRVEKWLARSNGRLAMDEFVASIPFFETRGYVQNVLAYDYYYQWLQGEKNLLMFTPEELRLY